MVTQDTVISFEQLVQDFDGLFRRRVFRLETLDCYDAPNEREPYARFLAGQPADWAWREPWKKLVRDVRASGRRMERVHVITEPPGDYARFELLRVYPASVEAGEDVRILSRTQPSTASLLRCDFWLFDDEYAAVLDYDGGGRVERVHLVSTQDDPLWFGGIRDEALDLAIPLAQYVAEHDITEGKHAA